MKKQIIGVFCPLCKERFYKNDLISEEELKKYSREKVHIVEKFPKYCSRCGGYLRQIRKYVISERKEGKEGKGKEGKEGKGKEGKDAVPAA